MIDSLDSFDPVATHDVGPAFRQIASSIRAAIAEGRLVVGQRLPTQSELATHFRVARETVKRALRMLQAEGLVVSRQGSGAFVAAVANRDGDPVTGQQKATCLLNAEGGGSEMVNGRGVIHAGALPEHVGNMGNPSVPVCLVIVIHQPACPEHAETGDSLYGLTSDTGCEAVAVYLARWHSTLADGSG